MLPRQGRTRGRVRKWSYPDVRTCFGKPASHFVRWGRFRDSVGAASGRGLPDFSFARLCPPRAGWKVGIGAGSGRTASRYSLGMGRWPLSLHSGTDPRALLCPSRTELRPAVSLSDGAAVDAASPWGRRRGCCRLPLGGGRAAAAAGFPRWRSRCCCRLPLGVGAAAASASLGDGATVAAGFPRGRSPGRGRFPRGRSCGRCRFPRGRRQIAKG